MSDKQHHLRVGAFALAALGLVAVVLIVFGGIRFWAHHDHYYVEFDDSVMGLEGGTQVYFDGIQVGNVGKIEVAPGNLGHVRVRVDLDPSTDIRTDTKAELSMAGITGLKVIDLHGGSVSAPKLPEDAVIQTKQGTLSKLEKQAEDLADKSGKIMERATAIADRADHVMANLDRITDPKVYEDTLASLATAAHTLNDVIGENRVVLHDTMTTIAATTKEAHEALKSTVTTITATTDDARGLIADLRGAVKTDQGSVSSALVDLRQAARSFKELAREVREKPSSVLFSGAAKDRKLP